MIWGKTEMWKCWDFEYLNRKGTDMEKNGIEINVINVSMMTRKNEKIQLML